MRRQLVVIGIVFLLVGLPLWYFPVQSVDTGPVLDGGTSFVLGDIAPFNVLGARVPFTLSWTSHIGGLNVSLYRCGEKPTCTNLKPSTFVAGEFGDAGTLHWEGRAGIYYVLVTSGKPLTVSIDYPQPVLGGTAGLVSVVFGGMMLGLGLWLLPPADAGPAAAKRKPEDEVLGPDPF
ncbi:MAG TPA: hypothetical protein VML94_00050 [Thermoplasmata archaeon]|nr:hypothetical protein [Thermoplasmata archaeon]